MHFDKGSFLTLDLEDFSYDLSRSLNLKNLKTRSAAIKKAIDRFSDILAKQKALKILPFLLLLRLLEIILN